MMHFCGLYVNFLLVLIVFTLEIFIIGDLKVKVMTFKMSHSKIQGFPPASNAET